MTEEDLLLYELMVIIDPELGEEATTKELEKIKKFIKDLDGEITHEDIWGIKSMAYTIKKQDSGFYVVLNFKIDPEKIKEFKSELALEQSLLRYMILKTPKHYEVATLDELEKKAEQYKEKKEEAKEAPKEEPKPVPKPEPKPEPVKEEEPEVEEEVAEETVPEVKEEVVEEAAPEVEEEVVEETAPEVEEEVVVEEAAPEVEPEPEEKEEIKLADKQELEDVDAKLRSIIDDPDISL